MSEQFYILAIVLGCAFMLTVPVVSILALCLGRGLRAVGVARIGLNKEFSVHVEVPAVAPLPPNNEPDHTERPAIALQSTKLVRGR